MIVFHRSHRNEDVDHRTGEIVPSTCSPRVVEEMTPVFNRERCIPHKENLHKAKLCGDQHPRSERVDIYVDEVKWDSRYRKMIGFLYRHYGNAE